MKFKIIFLALIWIIFAFTIISADVPKMINYQGKLTDHQGALITDTLSIQFAIYDDSISGALLWSETQSQVVIHHGVFSVLLGSVNSIPDSVFDGNVRYLGVKVGDDSEMIPRKAIVSVGYAYKSEYTDTAEYAKVAVSDGDWTIDGDNLFRMNGNIGIGTTNPIAKLDIVGNSYDEHLRLTNTGTTGAGPAIYLDGINHNWAIIGTNQSSMPGDGYLGFFQHTASIEQYRMVIDSLGRVGIGTMSPSNKLDVAGNIKMIGFQMPTNAHNGYVLTSDASGDGTWQSVSGIPDADWSFRITDSADTTLLSGGRWGIARYGNELFGNADSTHVNFGVACTTGTSGQNYKYCTVSGGWDNNASNYGTTVGGGRRNIANKVLATVGGGSDNTASGGDATVSGGYTNTAGGSGSSVGGGYYNTAIAQASTVAGGSVNTADGQEATVGGGAYNTASGQNSTIGGGNRNAVNGYSATVPGGYADTVDGDYSLAAGDRVRISSDADYTFAFGRNFITSTPNAVIFHNSVDPIKMGVQTTAPDEELHIVGNIKIVDGNQGAGKVLTSDGSGVGTWQQPSLPGTPGVSFSSKLNYSVTGSYTDACTLSITLPDSGYVVVTASGYTYINKTDTHECNCTMSISETSSTNDATNEQAAGINANASNGNYRFPFSITKTFQVSNSGSKSFYLVTKNLDASYSSDNLHHIQMTAVYYSARY